jgi:hypothetical protein
MYVSNWSLTQIDSVLEKGAAGNIRTGEGGCDMGLGKGHAELLPVVYLLQILLL